MLQDQDLLSIQEVRAKVEQAYAAWTRYQSVSQLGADAIVEAMASAARTNAQRLAERAVEETGYGNAPDKFAMPSCPCNWPTAVSQAESTTKSAFNRS